MAKLKEQLTRADLHLKRISIASTILAIAISIGTLATSGSLAYRQYVESNEKARVSYSYKLTPILLPSGNEFYIRARIKNLSTRELTVLGLTARVWLGDRWSDSSKISTQPNDLLMADNLVSNCPENLCPSSSPTGAQSGQPQKPEPKAKFNRLSRRDLGDDITLETTEGESEKSLGPYPITTDQLNQGFWLIGRAYVVETDSGRCAIHATEEPPQGTFPYVCEEGSNGEHGCYNNARCSFAESPATFYEFRAKDKNLVPK
jgi:hypothetical protein